MAMVAVFLIKVRDRNSPKCKSLVHVSKVPKITGQNELAALQYGVVHA